MGIFLTTANLECLLSSAVLGTTGNPQAVRLFPKETCTCPSASLCYHIMAMRMSEWINRNLCQKLSYVDQQKPLSKVKLSRLRRNARSKKDKTSGRKNQGLVIMMLSLLQIPSPVKNSATDG